MTRDAMIPKLSFKLDARSRALLVLLAALVAGLVCYRKVYQPRAVFLASVRDRYLALKGEGARLKSTMPSIKVEQEKVEALKKEYENLSAQIADTEKALPKNINIPDILKYLVKDKDKYNLKLSNIRSRKDKAQDIPLYIPPKDSKQKTISYYSVLPIEMEVFGSFDDIIGYIQNLEKRYPYQRLGSLQIDMQKTSGGQPESLLTILSLLGRGAEEDVSFKEFQLALKKAGKLSDSADPFRKDVRPRTEERLAGAQLNGIIWKKGIPYAIIDGASYKTGDMLGGKRIVEIGKDNVALEEEDKLFRLSISGE